jgi:hypothetical protein
MDRLEETMSAIVYLTANKKKRHIIGGVLLSVSLLFGGLALTVMSIKNEEKDDYEQDVD